jgi:UDP-GlcNAc3NAcA epimerase
MRICTVIGARPQFVKAAVLSKAYQKAGIEEEIVHTGQHYDVGMDKVFFDEMGIPNPKLNLHVGSGAHGAQTAKMMIGIEEFLEDSKPFDALVTIGDTNSTVAAALVAVKRQLPIAHVEAGLRSFNWQMPEEINRILTDRISALLFCPTQTAVDNLAKEGIRQGVHLVGDVMYDATMLFVKQASEQMPLQNIIGFESKQYYLATIHRAENTDDTQKLAVLFNALAQLDAPVVLPLHPRTKSKLADIAIGSNIHIIDPVSYVQMLSLTQNAKKVLTDSGGLQKEAFWLGTPCITLRTETEWVETLHNGWNQIVGIDNQAVLDAVAKAPSGAPFPFGLAPNGNFACQEIVAYLCK